MKNVYGVPDKYITCPGCGQIYGHDDTKVDTISQECSECVVTFGYKEVDLMDAKNYIEDVLGYVQIHN